MTLDEELDRVMTLRGINEEHQTSIRTYLHVLREKDEKTYEHSVRVGVLASEIAERLNEPRATPRMLLWAGLLHDIGKSLVPAELLRKKGGFSDADRAAVEPHVLHGWEMLHGVHDYTARIIVRHHQYGARPYPLVLPPLPNKGLPVKAVNFAARILALADFYDALMNRNNDKNGSIELSLQEKRELFIENNKDQKELIKALEGILFFKVEEK